MGRGVRKPLAVLVLVGVLALVPAAADGARMGPLVVSKDNPRYFARPDGRPVFLTGSHVWHNLVDRGTTSPPAAFDFDAYLDLLQGNGHTFIRLWTWELPVSKLAWWEPVLYTAPQPWLRTGPGLAQDGLPRFDLNQFDPAYFERLRARVAAAQARGIYVSVMLFEGFGIQFAEAPLQWMSHPFNAGNNVNALEADRNGDGFGHEAHTLASGDVWRVQVRYVRKVIDTLNGFDNVLYEIANESSSQYSTDWQHWFVRDIKRYQLRKPQQHPVGMTFQWQPGSNEALYASGAHWISPSGGRYWVDRPPRSDGAKVVLSDTDHHCGVCGDSDFVWKNALQGHNPIYMDPLDADPERVEARLAMGDAGHWVRRVGLKKALPRPRWTTTGYMLANPGVRYLAYQPGSGRFRLWLGKTRRTYDVEWYDPIRRVAVDGRWTRGRGWKTIGAPFTGPAVVLLRARSR